MQLDFSDGLFEHLFRSNEKRYNLQMEPERFSLTELGNSFMFVIRLYNLRNPHVGYLLKIFHLSYKIKK